MNDLCFFFQAEDGIRDYKVTGVQTCALPISIRKPASWLSRSACRRSKSISNTTCRPTRSEERRVGKECRSRWWPQHSKKKTAFTEKPNFNINHKNFHDHDADPHLSV